jgi:hypothetical protein
MQFSTVYFSPDPKSKNVKMKPSKKLLQGAITITIDHRKLLRENLSLELELTID